MTVNRTVKEHGEDVAGNGERRVQRETEDEGVRRERSEGASLASYVLPYTCYLLRRLEQLAQAVLLYHAFDGLPIDAGFPRRSPHVALVTLEEVDQKASFKGRHGGLLGIFEGSGFAASGFLAPSLPQTVG